MKSNLEIIKLNVSLDDSEKVFYNFEHDILIITVVNWSGKCIEFIFTGVALFINWADLQSISKLIFNSSGITSIGEAIDNYVQIGLLDQNNLRYSLYQFVDKSGDPCLEIGCANFNFNIYESEFEYSNSKKNIKKEKIKARKTINSLSKVKIVSFSESNEEDYISLILLTSTGEQMKFTFKEVILFIYRLGLIEKFCLSEDTPEPFQKAINRFYSPASKPLEDLYHFVDSKNISIVEVACSCFAIEF